VVTVAAAAWLGLVGCQPLLEPSSLDSEGESDDSMVH
jgi:hypothetical protein